MANNVILPSFAAGELSPGLAARVDLAKYHVGAALLENFFVDYKGGAASRPGTQHIGLSHAGSPAWLYKFVFSATQQYVLVFTENTIQFIRNPGGATNHSNGSNSGFIQSGGVNYSIGTSYQSNELADLKFAQYGDVLQITHPNHPRTILRRFADDNWTLSEPQIGSNVVKPGNVVATITPKPTGSSDPETTTYLYTVTAVSRNGEESSLGSFGDVTGIDMANTAGTVTVQWDNVVDAGYYNIYKAIPGYSNQFPPFNSSFGFCGISYGTVFIDSNIVADFTKAPPLHYDPFAPKQIIEVVVTSSSSDWPVGHTTLQVTDSTGFGAYLLAVLDNTTVGGTGAIVDVFIVNGGQDYTSPTVAAVGSTGTVATFSVTLSSAAEHPTSVAYNQQRLVVAGTTSFPTGIFGSKTGFYDNFDRSNPVLDDDAFTFIVAAPEINAILHMVPMPGGLVIFSNSGIQQLTGGSSSAQNPSAITPSSIVVVPQSYFGASRVRPLVVNKNILYVQDPGTNVQDLAYNLFVNIYEGSDLTSLASHLFYPHTIVQWDYQHTPFRVVWAVRDDGVLLSLTYLREQEVVAWAHHHTPGGLYKSVTVIREGNMDAVYFTVSRDGVYHVERLCSRVYNTITDAWCLDNALAYLGSPTTVLTGLDHLNGETVTVFGNFSNNLGSFVVSGGSVTLPIAVSRAVVGLLYTPRFKTVQLDLGNEGATIQGKRKRVAAASIRVRDSAAIKVGTTFNSLTPFVPNVSSTDDMSLAPVGLITGDMRLVIDPSYNVQGQICVQQDDPFPVTILGIIPEIVVGDTTR